jgi:hypothetical protein
MIVKFLKLIVLTVHTRIILNVYKDFKDPDHRENVLFVGASIGLNDPSEEDLLQLLFQLLFQLLLQLLLQLLHQVEVALPHNSKQKFGNLWDWV